MATRKKRLAERFLTVFGDIKVFRWPMFVVYDPGSYKVRGAHMREAMKRVRPGDILLRRYDSYLDGFFIPGYFSHVGMYLGEVTEADAAHVPESMRGRVKTGEQMVIHALAEGVLMEDLFDFFRCDGLLIVRPPKLLRRTWQGSTPLFEQAREEMSAGERELYQRLEDGGEVDFDREAFPVIFRTALAQLGRGYDFDFDFTDFKHLSCSELVFYAMKAIAPALGIVPTAKKIAFLRRTLIAPDAFVTRTLELAYQSPSVDARRTAKLFRAEPMVEADPSRRAA